MLSKKIYISVLASAICLLLFSCKDKKDELYGISIDASRMVGTPAEVFSIQHVKMFQASNSFIMEFLPELNSDSVDFAIAPFYALSSLAMDTNLAAYFSCYAAYYNLSQHNANETKQAFNSFLTAIQSIDSSFNISNSLFVQANDTLNLTQSLTITLCYENNFKQEENKINISGEFLTLESHDETVCEIPFGNGNFVLDLLQPKAMSLKEYYNTFNEEHYATIFKQLENRKINVSFPKLDIAFESLPLNMPQIPKTDSTGIFNKLLMLTCSFKVENQTQNTASSILQSNDSEPIVFERPFLFLVRGKNSNLIFFIGYCNL